jgi:chromosome segregation protein
VQDRLEEAESDAERTGGEVAALGRQLDARQNEYNLTKSLVDNLEGFPEASSSSARVASGPPRPRWCPTS